MVMDIFWVVLGGSGGLQWVWFGWWLVVVSLFWVVMGGDGYIFFYFFFSINVQHLVNYTAKTYKGYMLSMPNQQLN